MTGPWRKRRPSHPPRQRLNRALRSWGVRQDHIPRGRTIPMGAVPVLARGLGHTAPTYSRRRPGSPSNGLLGPALLSTGSAVRSRPCPCRSRSPNPPRSQIPSAPPGARPPPRRRPGDPRRVERAARRGRARLGAALAAARRRRLLSDPRRARHRAAPRRAAGARLRDRSAGHGGRRRRWSSACGGPAIRWRAARWACPSPTPRPPVVDPDLLFMPLAAFDRRGHRIGYGAGHYDRTLKRLRAQRPDPRRRRRLFRHRSSTPRPMSRTTSRSTSSSPSAN